MLIWPLVSKNLKRNMLTLSKRTRHWKTQLKILDPRDLSEADMKEILHKRMFESGSYISHPEHASLYEALERSMDYDNREAFLKEKEKFHKRRRDD
ncbi:hypothetical protein Tco_0503107 [Tanacetum coccineum]